MKKTKPCERCAVAVDLFEDDYPPIAILCASCVQAIDDDQEIAPCPKTWCEDDGEIAYCAREAGHPGACDWRADLGKGPSPKLAP